MGDGRHAVVAAGCEGGMMTVDHPPEKTMNNLDLPADVVARLATIDRPTTVTDPAGGLAAVVVPPDLYRQMYILYAARNESLSNVWNFSVMSEARASRWSVGMRFRHSSMAARKVAKSA